MGKALQGLVGTTCICIVAAIGWWAVSGARATGETRRAGGGAVSADDARTTAICDKVIRAADAGDKRPAVQRAGLDRADAYIDNCRVIAKLDAIIADRD